jgi:hypothetical protein
MRANSADGSGVAVGFFSCCGLSMKVDRKGRRGGREEEREVERGEQEREGEGFTSKNGELRLRFIRDEMTPPPKMLSMDASLREGLGGSGSKEESKFIAKGELKLGLLKIAAFVEEFGEEESGDLGGDDLGEEERGVGLEEDGAGSDLGEEGVGSDLRGDAFGEEERGAGLG